MAHILAGGIPRDCYADNTDDNDGMAAKTTPWLTYVFLLSATSRPIRAY